MVQQRLGQLVTQAQRLDTAHVKKQSAQMDFASAEQQMVNQVLILILMDPVSIDYKINCKLKGKLKFSN